MDGAMKTLSTHKRVNAAKYTMFDLQNTGEQKQRFENIAARSKDRDITQVDLCPLNCGCKETAQHFLKCPVMQNANIMDQCFTLLNWCFAKNRTHPVLQKLLMIAIRAWVNDTELSMDMEVPADLQEWGIHNALNEQSCIGWKKFMKGHITPTFSTIQMKAYEQDYRMDGIPAHYSAALLEPECMVATKQLPPQKQNNDTRST